MHRDNIDLDGSLKFTGKRKKERKRDRDKEGKRQTDRQTDRDRETNKSILATRSAAGAK